jgi:glycosyltransferase involved in cell wall biosynthesis
MVVMLRGNIDRVDHDRITGWACLTADIQRKQLVRYRSPTGETFEAIAQLRRPDLERAGIGDGACGFSIELPKGHRIDPKTDRIEVEVVGAAESLVYVPGTLPEQAPRTPAPAISGRIESVQNGLISGWMVSPHSESILPVLTLDGRPLANLDYPVARPDVEEAFGLQGQYGFVCAAPGMREGAVIELHALSGNRSSCIASLTVAAPQLETSFLRQLVRAAEIAAQPGAVAITCWDGGHNPIGRAKVLHDVLKGHRPAVIVSYLFDEFGGQIWPPLQSTDTALLTIPWINRDLYHRAIRSQGLAFETVWICKPRYPAFQLAAHLASPTARLILDFDDNEEHFSRSTASASKPYGLPTLGLVRYLTDRIPSRTAASVTLAQEFGATILRHARAGRAPVPPVSMLARHGMADAPQGTAALSHGDAANDPCPVRQPSPGPRKIGFIGTVRPHKHLLAAARAVRIFNRNSGLNVVLHVYGDVQPESHAQQLRDTQVVVRQTIPMAELADHLAQMDVILTGFPGSSAEHAEVTRYQISSKIGDALAAGLPVLVPAAPSVADLALQVPGVYTFDELSFGEALTAALEHRGEIALPQDFTFEGAYTAFTLAETRAQTSPRAAKVLFDLFPVEAHTNLPEPTPCLLLVWKQHDARLYGRRVDQVSRSYKRAFPGHRVVILELLHSTRREAYRKNQGNFTSEDGLLMRQMAGKAMHTADEDGVTVCQICCDAMMQFGEQVEQFLLEQQMLPMNTVVVLFPIIDFFKQIADILDPYPKIVDVVDNQFGWAPTQERKNFLTAQYYALSRNCDRILFNSQRNRDHFAALRFLPETVSHKIVPNWYELPVGVATNSESGEIGPHFNVIYSGNMNDRVDWRLIERVAGLSETIRVHLVGTVNAGNQAFLATISHPNILVHGPRSERETLHLMRSMDLAIMPHRVDEFSAFMNPLKVQMYLAFGLPCVATDVPGIVPSDHLTVARSEDDFIAAVRQHSATRGTRCAPAPVSDSAVHYLAEIQAVRDESAARRTQAPCPALSGEGGL